MAGSTQLSAAAGFACPFIQRNKATSGLGAASSALIVAAVAVGARIAGDAEGKFVTSAAGETFGKVELAVVVVVRVLVVVVVVVVAPV